PRRYPRWSDEANHAEEFFAQGFPSSRRAPKPGSLLVSVLRAMPDSNCDRHLALLQQLPDFRCCLLAPAFTFARSHWHVCGRSKKLERAVLFCPSLSSAKDTSIIYFDEVAKLRTESLVGNFRDLEERDHVDDLLPQTWCNPGV
ncbi:hypothetical protein OZ411_34705, partial [Bradyrhizobium sp. Arg237L]|uniref:hypothetical protein n=1 Tax=Bradyrhizobium sp. Arg237L TaxID=3003352 RepID=UPI00249EE995